MKQTGAIRKPYTGQKKAIAIALDVGTTFSGASYAILDPGEIPKIYEVTRFPGQEHQAGNPKIPSVIWYDRHGDVAKAGAEAEEQSNINTAEEQGWTKVELFKLRLRPKSMKLDMNGMKLPHLPRSKSALEVFGDFLKYLFRCTRSFIVETHAGGAIVWKSVENDIQFVLSHPNGWEGAQQSKMRKAAIYGGLVPNTDEGKARVRFVTEGEASLHACVLNGLATEVLANPSQHGFVVADAGGGTLDVSSYAIKGASPLLIEEIAPPDCLFSGSVFVSRRARIFLERKLEGSKYGTAGMLDHIAKRFDETTKRLFRSRTENQYILFGSPLDKDPNFGIRNGKLKLTGDEVAELFEPSIEAAVSSIRNQVVLSGGMVKSVWLVGGFASSPWLFHQLQERLEPDGIIVSRPDGQTSKAVANGAIGFYCDHHVGARIAKYMYGVEFLREFDPMDPDHKERENRLFQLPSGPKLLPDAFDCILARNSRVKESTTFSRKYCTELTSLSTLSLFEIEIWCCRGPGDQPKWILRGQDDFSTLCFVRADLSPLTASAKAMTGQGGKKYWTIVFSIEIHFGLTEFKARIKWTDDGKVKYGPASIVYDESGNKELEDDRDSQDEISGLPPSRFGSRAPSMAPSRTHSMSNTPHTLQSPVDDHSAAGMSRSLSAGQPHTDRHPDDFAESSVSKKSKSSGSHSHHISPTQQLSPNPSNVSHHTSRSDRSQHSAHSSQHPSNYSASPREPPRDVSHHSSPHREPSHPPVSHPVSREISQFDHQSDTASPASTVQSQLRDRETQRSVPNYYASTPTQSHLSQAQAFPPPPLPSVLNDTTSSISRGHGRSQSIVSPTQPPEPASIKFPSVSTTGSPYETPAPRSMMNSRTTSLTPSDSASNVHANFLYGNGTTPGSVTGSVAGSPLPESTGKKGKKDKTKSRLSTIASAINSMTNPPADQPQPPEPAPSIPQITIPDSPAVSSSLGGSGLTTNPHTPNLMRSIKSSFASSLSYATDHPDQPPIPPPSSMSRQNSDTGSVTAGGLGNALGGVLTGVWGSYKSASASPVVENPPHGFASATFDPTLETIHDVEFPGGFGGEREKEALFSPPSTVAEPVVIPPSPPKPEDSAPPKAPSPRVELNYPPPSEPAPQPEAETVPQTPSELGQSAISPAERKKLKKQREKEKKEKDAQEKKEREERERVELEREREEQQRREREEREKKKQDKAERDARKVREREERELREQQERAEQERLAKEAHERAELEARQRAEYEAKERADREARKRAEREAKDRADREAREQADREAKERAERAARVERQTREAQERAEREAKEQAEAREKMDKISRKRAEREAAKEAKERAEREAKEKAEREAKERADEAARVKAEKEAKRKAEKEAREQADREAREKAEREAKEKADQEERERLERKEKERLEREKERIEREEKEKADREAKEREEEEKRKATASKQPAWGTKNGDRSRKTSALAQKEQKNEWGNTWGFGSSETKDESPGLPPLITSSVPGGMFDGAGKFDFFAKADSPGGGGDGEGVELRTPLTKKGKRGFDSPSNLSKAATPVETTDTSKGDVLEDFGLRNVGLGNRSARASFSSENERFTDAEQGLPSPEPTNQTLAPEVASDAWQNSTFGLLETPKGAKEEVPTTPKPWPAPSLAATQPQVPTPTPAPAKSEPEKPLSLWERKKFKSTAQPTSASGLFAAGDSANTSDVWGDTGGSGGNAETIAMPTLTGNGDRQSTFTDTARDQKRENQRENLVEGFLGSNPPRRRNESPTKPAPKPAQVPSPPPAQKSGWGWGGSLLNTIANAANTITAPDRTPSPEAAPVKPKIEEPPRWHTPGQPPKSQPAGFGPMKPAWGNSTGGNNTGSSKDGPTQPLQKPSTGPAWGAKPAGSTFGTGGTAWGGAAGSTFGSGIGKNLTVDTTTKPPESGPNTAGPENIPESAVEIKQVPAPGRFHSSVMDKKEGAGETQDDAWGLGEGEGAKDKDSKASKPPSPAQEPIEQTPEQAAEESEEPAKTEEAATPEEDEFDWANVGKKKKKGQVASVAQTPSAPNTPDPDNADDGHTGGAGGKRKKKKGKK